MSYSNEVVSPVIGLKTEAPWICEKRKEMIAYLRSFTPSKYVLDGAVIDCRNPTILPKWLATRKELPEWLATRNAGGANA